MNKSDISLQQRLAICSQVAKLIEAKLPISGRLSQALASSSKPVQELGSQIDKDVQSGKPWSEALLADQTPETQVLAACIEAGEASDRLDASLQAWTNMHLSNTKAKRTFRSALLYPILLILVTIVSLSCLSYWLIPQYRETYQLFDQELPSWLEWIVFVRENTVAMVLFIVLGAAGPLVFFSWMRLRTGRGQRDRKAKSLRQQALATEIASLMTGASIPLQTATSVTARAAGAEIEEATRAWELVQKKKSVPALPKESSLLLGSAHAGILTARETSEHLGEVASNLRRSAELLEAAHARWVPMLVALSVGAVTILAYVFLIFLPWIWLMQKIADPILLGSLNA